MVPGPYALFCKPYSIVVQLRAQTFIVRKPHKINKIQSSMAVDIFYYHIFQYLIQLKWTFENIHIFKIINNGRFYHPTSYEIRWFIHKAWIIPINLMLSVLNMEKYGIIFISISNIPLVFINSGIDTAPSFTKIFFSIFKTHNIQSIGIIHALCINHLISYNVGW